MFQNKLNYMCYFCAFTLLQDRAVVEEFESNKIIRRMKKRICLVLDCLCAHDFSDKTADLINLQHYVIKEKRLSERETIAIFYDVVRVVEALHKVRGCWHLKKICSGDICWRGQIFIGVCLWHSEQGSQECNPLITGVVLGWAWGG